MVPTNNGEKDLMSLEGWVTTQVDTPSGPRGRRARWHETLSRFNQHVEYIPVKDNIIADAISRFAKTRKQCKRRRQLLRQCSSRRGSEKCFCTRNCGRKISGNGTLGTEENGRSRICTRDWVPSRKRKLENM